MTDSLRSFTLAPLCLTGGAVDRGGEDRRKQGWLDAALADPTTRVLPLFKAATPVRGAALAGLTVEQLGDALGGAASLVWLGRVGGTSWVAAAFSEEPEGWESWGHAAGLREVGKELSRDEAALFTQAVAVTHWHSVSAYCARCGAPNEVIDAGWVRRCTAEGTEHFPRTDPAVIVLITDDDDRVLLGANAAWGGSRYSLFAGFVEPGESLEEAVLREAGEEAGVSLADPVYVASQPWPFPASLMLGFTARALSTRTVPDGEEILSTRWFTRQELAREVASGRIGVPGDVSVAGALLRGWYGGELPEPGTSPQASRGTEPAAAASGTGAATGGQK